MRSSNSSYVLLGIDLISILILILDKYGNRFDVKILFKERILMRTSNSSHVLLAIDLISILILDKYGNRYDVKILFKSIFLNLMRSSNSSHVLLGIQMKFNDPKN